MKSLFLKILVVLLFVTFVIPGAYELSSQQVPKDKNSQLQQKDRQRLRDGSGVGKHKRHEPKRKHKKVKKHKKIKKFKHIRGRW
jgi:hypothetical protein